MATQAESRSPAATSPAAGGPLRLFLYVFAFAGLAASLYALAGIVAFVLFAILPDSQQVLAGANLTQQLSLFVAALIVGGPVWLTCFYFAERHVQVDSALVHATSRRLFYAAVFALTGIMTLLNLSGTLTSLVTLTFHADQKLPATLVLAVARLLVYGASGLTYWQLAGRHLVHVTRDSPTNALQDAALFLVMAVALVMLAAGISSLVQDAASALIGMATPSLMPGTPAASLEEWANAMARTIGAALVWFLLLFFESARRERIAWRNVYLIAALVVAVPTTLVTTGLFLAEILLLAFGGADSWPGPFTDYLPLALTGTAVWIVHWGIVRQQAAFTVPEAGPGVLHPLRRLGLILLSAFALVVGTSALEYCLWVAFDLMFNVSVAGVLADWWKQPLSTGLALGVINTGAWLASWFTLDRAARRAPAAEQAHRDRRVYLVAVIVAASVSGIGFLIGTLWLVLRWLLGEPLLASTESWMLKDLSAALVSLGVLAYHALVLRQDLAIPAPAIAATVAAPVSGPPVLSIQLFRGTGALSSQELMTLLAGAGAAISTEAAIDSTDLSTPIPMDGLVAALKALQQGGRSGAVVVALQNGALVLPIVDSLTDGRHAP